MSSHNGIKIYSFREGEALSVNPVLPSLKRLIRSCLDRSHTRFVRWTRPHNTSLLLGTIADLGRSKSELLVENALLRQQLIVLKRQVKRPACTKADRLLLVLLARVVRTWKQALFIVQPETLLRWHRESFRQFWKRRSKANSHKPKVAAETVILIKEMAAQNRRLVSGADPWRIAQVGYSGE
jgi:putative transposase